MDLKAQETGDFSKFRLSQETVELLKGLIMFDYYEHGLPTIPLLVLYLLHYYMFTCLELVCNTLLIFHFFFPFREENQLSFPCPK